MDEAQSNRYTTGHVRNPLTVISRFAAVAEISGTAVLPFIEPANQATYIWFLMLFPAFLVGLFFITLNFNHKTLYAPSDYKNQNHFLHLFGITTEDERRDKLQAELQEETPVPPGPPMPDPQAPQGQEISAQMPCEPEKPTGPSGCDDKTPHPDHSDADTSKHNDAEETSPAMSSGQDSNQASATTLNLDEIKKQDRKNLMKKLGDIENRALAKLHTATKITFDRNLKIETPHPNQPIIFDGLSISPEEVHATEVKYFDTKGFSVNRILPTLHQAAQAAQLIKLSISRRFIFHLVIVVNKPLDGKQADIISSACQRVASAMGLTTNVYVIEADKLLSNEPYTFYERGYPKG